MKSIISVLLSLLILASAQAEDSEKAVNSTIRYVTVFTQGAQVLREAETMIPQGKSVLMFTGITAGLDRRSIHVKGDGAFTIMAVNYQVDFKEPDWDLDQIEALENSLDSLKSEVEIEKALLSVLEEEEIIILTNKNVPKKEWVTIDEIRTMAELYKTRLKEIRLEKIRIRKAIEADGEKLREIETQLDELQRKKGTFSSEILVVVNADQATTGRFTLSYFVGNAGWTPHYDLRVKDIQNPVNLTYKANVYQTSGEDWQEVPLTLSTGDPSQSGSKPVLQPWYLRFGRTYADNRPQGGVYYGALSTDLRKVEGYVYDTSGDALIGASVMVKGTTIGAITDVNGYYTLEVPSGPQILMVSYVGYDNVEAPINSSAMNIILEEGVQLNEVVVTGGYARPGIFDRMKERKRARRERKEAEKLAATKPLPTQQQSRTTTVEFKIDLPYNVPSDGKQYEVEMQRYDLPAFYQYYCVPKLNPSAFLVAEVTDWEQYNLLDGDANLYFEGTYLGKSRLNVEGLEDTLQLSLGRDKGIQIERTKIKEYSRRKFLSSKQVASRAFIIKVRNNKKQPVNLVIEDQLPLTTQKNIEVEYQSYEGATLNEDTGQLLWKLSLAPQESQNVEFRYSVRYPKKQYLELE